MDHVSQYAGRRPSRSEALRLAFEYERSGLTRRVFSQQHGLSLASLNNYRKLRGNHSDARPSSNTDLDLVPVELSDCVSPAQP
jgi:hypothetical protein